MGSPTDLLPQFGMPTVWMMYTATWKKNTKKKKKKLKELSDLQEEKIQIYVIRFRLEVKEGPMDR